jgi:bacteriocin biosynthesis cyclodehydratase domain-containing protein
MTVRQYYLPVIKALDAGVPEHLPAGLTNDAMVALFTSLDGKRSVSQIWGRLLSEGLSPDVISAGLEYLDSRDLIEEGDPGIQALSTAELDKFSSQMRVLAKSFPSPFAAEVTSEEVEGMRMQAALKNARLVIADGGEVATALARHLAQAGFGHVTLAPPRTDGSSPSLVDATRAAENGATQKPALMIHCPDEFVADRCEQINRACLKERIPMLPYRRIGLEVEIGPLIVPYETACYTCYTKRRDAVLSPWERQRAAANNDLGVFSVPLGLDFLLIEALKVVLGRSEPVTQGRLLRLSFVGGIPELHPVLKLPRCPTCGVHRVKPARKLWEE